MANGEWGMVRGSGRGSIQEYNKSHKRKHATNKHTQPARMQMKLKCKFRPNGKFRSDDCERKWAKCSSQLPPLTSQLPAMAPSDRWETEWQMKRTQIL